MRFSTAIPPRGLFRLPKRFLGVPYPFQQTTSFEGHGKVKPTMRLDWDGPSAHPATPSFPAGTHQLSGHAASEEFPRRGHDISTQNGALRIPDIRRTRFLVLSIRVGSTKIRSWSLELSFRGNEFQDDSQTVFGRACWGVSQRGKWTHSEAVHRAQGGILIVWNSSYDLSNYTVRSLLGGLEGVGLHWKEQVGLRRRLCEICSACEKISHYAVESCYHETLFIKALGDFPFPIVCDEHAMKCPLPKLLSCGPMSEELGKDSYSKAEPISWPSIQLVALNLLCDWQRWSSGKIGCQA